jgi:MFS family permease
MEWAQSNKNRGFIAAWPQFGAPAGLFLANLAVLIFSWISGDQFLTWGWRIPFLLSIVMVGVGLQHGRAYAKLVAIGCGFKFCLPPISSRLSLYTRHTSVVDVTPDSRRRRGRAHVVHGRAHPSMIA